MKTSESVNKLAGCEGALEKLIGNIGPYLPLNQGFQTRGLRMSRNYIIKKIIFLLFFQFYTENCKLNFF